MQPWGEHKPVVPRSPSVSHSLDSSLPEGALLKNDVSVTAVGDGDDRKNGSSKLLYDVNDSLARTDKKSISAEYG